MDKFLYLVVGMLLAVVLLYTTATCVELPIPQGATGCYWRRIW